MNRTNRHSLFLLTAALCLIVQCSAVFADEPHYKLLKPIQIGGGSGWDYLYADAASRRLYVTHGTKIIVIDMDADKVVGEIVDTPGVHGFIPIPELKRGFSSNGQENKSSIVDLETLKTVSKVTTGANPDALLYEPKSSEVWIFNGRSQSATVIEAKTGKVIVEAIPLGGKPEAGVVDSEAQKVYVNIEDTNEVAVIDMKKHKVIAQWRIAPATGATGLSLDAKLHRLLIGGGNSKMVLMDSTNGKVIDSIECGQGVDATAFDPETHLAFASAGGSGTVTIVKVEAEKLTAVQTLTTERGARTMTVDTKSHRIYLANAKSRTEATSFKVLVYGME